MYYLGGEWMGVGVFCFVLLSSEFLNSEIHELVIEFQPAVHESLRY